VAIDGMASQKDVRASSRLRAIVSEPLVHFLVVGAVLLGLDRLRRDDAPAVPRSADSAPPAAAAPARTIRVGAEVRAWLKDGLARAAGGAAPSDAELDAAVARWIDEEVLYREGLARGLDRDDPAVRKRIAEKMGFILAKEIAIPPPSEAELRALFAAQRDRWAEPARIDFTHVFVAGSGAEAERRAGEILAALEGGADPATLGDRFSGGQHYRGRKPADLAESFGPEFSRGLEQQPAGAWRLRRSRHGLHLVRVDRFAPGGAADFASARLDVEKEWMDTRRAEALAERVRALRAKWPVVER